MLNPRRRYLRTDQIKRAQTLTKTRSWEGSVVAQRAGIVPGLVRLELRRDPARRTRRPLSTSGCRLLRFLEGFEPFLEFGHSTIEWINRTQLPRDIIEPTAQPLLTSATRRCGNPTIRRSVLSPLSASSAMRSPSRGSGPWVSAIPGLYGTSSRRGPMPTTVLNARRIKPRRPRPSHLVGGRRRQI